MHSFTKFLACLFRGNYCVRLQGEAEQEGEKGDGQPRPMLHGLSEWWRDPTKLVRRQDWGQMAGQDHVKKLEKSPYHLLKRAAQYAANIYMADVGKSGLTHRQFTVLTVVDGNEGIGQTELVKVTGIDRSTLADMISKLAAQGYLQRKRNKNDARNNRLHLTAAGRCALTSAQPGAADVDKQILAAIPATKRKELIEMLGLLAARVDNKGTPAANRSKTRPRAAKSARRAPGPSALYSGFRSVRRRR